MTRQYVTYLCDGVGGRDQGVRPPPECPNADQHEPSPTGYVASYEWHAKMARTHRQRQCEYCRYWVIYVPREPSPRSGTSKTGQLGCPDPSEGSTR